MFYWFKVFGRAVAGRNRNSSCYRILRRIWSGKSQICHTLCAMASRPLSEKGLDGQVIYIDTEGTFRPERIQQIAESRGFVSLEVLKNITVCKVYNSSHLELIIKDLGKYINEFNAKLIVIDS